MSKELIDCVLVDDDDVVRENWELKAKSLNRKIRTYANAIDFLNEADQVQHFLPVYINRVELAKDLNQKGFHNLYLTAGEMPVRFNDISFLNGVVKKAPPWQH